jgi:kynurenine formamidase
MAIRTASLAPEACEYLADVGVAAVASETAACDVAAKDGEIVAGHGHSQYFLPRGILIVEALGCAIERVDGRAAAQDQRWHRVAGSRPAPRWMRRAIARPWCVQMGRGWGFGTRARR